jgi:hypothetical protein
MKRILPFFLFLILLPQNADAHWCSNIYQSYARLVVKPDRERIDVAVGETKELKVRVRNNFPYTLHYIKLRANPPEGLSVTVSPDQSTAERIRVMAGQVLTFTLQITRDSEGTDEVADLNLEISTTVEDIQPGWRDSTDDWVNQNPDPDAIRRTIEADGFQALDLNFDTLADQNCPTCEQEGMEGLYGLYHSRLDHCDDTYIDDVWAMIFIRAGAHLAIRLRFDNLNQTPRQDVVPYMLAGMDDANDLTRGLAAFLAAYGGDDPGVRDRIQQMADSDPSGICTFDPSPRAQRMAKAALLVLGEKDQHAGVTACYNDESEDTRVRLLCAAALGMRGEDFPMINYVLPHTTDGKNTSYEGQYTGYLVQLVTYDRRGGPTGSGEATFLDEEPLPKPPGGGGCSVSSPGSSQGSTSGGSSLLLLLLLSALLRRENR